MDWLLICFEAYLHTPVTLVCIITGKDKYNLIEKKDFYRVSKVQGVNSYEAD